MSQHINLESLNTLKDIMEDDFIFLVETFISDSTLKIEELKIAIENQHADVVRRTAHSFKGSCSNLGINHLTELLANVEHKGLTANFSDMAEDVTHIEAEFHVVATLLNDIVK